MKTQLHLALLILSLFINAEQSFTQTVYWKKMKEPIGQTPNDIKRVGQYLLATTFQSTLLVSEDEGKRWEERYNPKVTWDTPSDTKGSSLVFDPDSTIVLSTGGYYFPQIRKSSDFGKSWRQIFSFTRALMHSLCTWDFGYITCGMNKVYVIDTLKKTKDIINQNFQKVFSLEEVFAFSDSGIYVSKRDTISFKKRVGFSTIGDSVDYLYDNGILFVTSGRMIYVSEDKGETWKIDSVPFIIKYFRKSENHFYAVDSKNRLWKAEVKRKRWGILLPKINNNREVTCLYVDEKQIIFGVKYEGIKRYSIQADKWLTEETTLPSVTPYDVRVTCDGVFVFPLYGSSTLYSGYCRTNDLGKSWKICHIAPYGMMYARISDNTKYYKGAFHDYDGAYNTCYAFYEDRGIGNVIPMVLPERDSACVYTFVLNDKLMRFSRKLDSITIIKDYVALSKHKTNFPYREIADQSGNSKIYVRQIHDTIICKNKSNDLDCYYSIDYGEKWTPYRDWRSEYGTGVEIISVGDKYLSVERSGLIKVFREGTQSWLTIHDSVSSKTKIYDYDYNDSTFVMCNEDGLFYITPDDLSEITSVDEEYGISADFRITSEVFTDVITFECRNNTSPYSIRVFSIVGQEVATVKNVTNTTLEVDASNFQPGVYFVEVVMDCARYVKKVLKM